jgi:hypothetical protein
MRVKQTGIAIPTMASGLGFEIFEVASGVLKGAFFYWQVGGSHCKSPRG